MALFPILTTDGNPILTSDGDVAVVVSGGSPITAGRLLVLSDRRDLGRTDAVTLDPTTGVILSHVPTPATLPFAALGDSVATGNFAVTREDTPATQVIAVDIYQPDYTLVTSLSVNTITAGAFPTSVSPNTVLKGNGSDRMYFAVQSTPSVVYSFTMDGVVGSTIWHLPGGVPTGPVRWMAITADDAILYSTKTGTANGIQAYDLVNSVALPALVTAGPSEFYEDLIALPSGDVLTLMQTNSATDDYQVQRYNAVGVLQATYPIGPAQLYELPILFIDHSNPTTFWVKAFTDATGASATYFNIVIATGVVRTSFVVQQSVVDGDGKVPSTCPELALPGVVSTTDPLRWLRRFALPNVGNLYQFFARGELLMQPGVGLSEGQGSDPIVMMRISRDGGMTWGNELEMHIGKMGEYDVRAYLNRLGRGRNLYVELTGTDPVPMVLLNFLADLETGSS